MKITVAGVIKEIGDETSIADLIRAEQVENPEYVTVVVNDEFIDREVFDTVRLTEGDKVEFLYFMGGGEVQ